MSKTPAVPNNIDHLVYAVLDLEAGMDEMEDLLGVRPVRGGKHPSFGTHNALLSLGARVYLELISPDPALPVPDLGYAFGLCGLSSPRLSTWALRDEQIEETAMAAVASGIHVGAVSTGKRQKPDGAVLEWQLSDPYAMLCDGLVPFLIRWGSRQHPADTAPVGGSLSSLHVEHPEPASLERSLAALGVKVNVRKRRTPALVAEIKSSLGTTVLR